MDLIEIGSLVKEARKTRSLTQAELARQSGMSRTTLNALENGQLSELGVGRLIRLLNVIGLELRIGQAQVYRPTLDELYALKAQQEIKRKVERYRG